jgi:hypothetical protein
MSPRPSQEESHYVTMIILNVIILFFAVFKVMYFFRSYDKFGQFVQLGITCVADMYVFMAFLLVCILLFSIEFTVLGVDYSNEEYPTMPISLYYFMQTFRNSIGDIAAPGYTKWLEYKEFK